MSCIIRNNKAIKNCTIGFLIILFITSSFLWYLEGTQPTQVCSVHSTANSSRTIGIYRLEKELYKAGFASELIIRDNSTLSFNLDKPLQSGDFGVFDTKLSPTDSQELDENGAAPNYNYLMD